jgi:hypothetical protein
LGKRISEIKDYLFEVMVFEINDELIQAIWSFATN